jgi:Ca2+-binding EF-hand superfamily protein
MRKRTSYVWFIGIIAVLLATLTLLGSATAQKASVPKTQDKLAMGEDDVKHLLLLMDADKKGMVSKQEFMKYMEAEFERLDKKKIGQLNVKELAQSSLSASHFVGK